MDANYKNELKKIKDMTTLKRRAFDLEKNRIQRECELLIRDLKMTKDDQNDTVEIDCIERAKSAYLTLFAWCNGNRAKLDYILNHIYEFSSQLPLTPITDDPYDWEEMKALPATHLKKKGLTKKEYCKRYPHMFRETYEDGSIVYRDNNRVTTIDHIFGTKYSFGLANLVYDKMFPIELPYNVISAQAYFYIHPFLSNREDEESEFDTAALLFIEKKDGEQIPVNRYFRVANEDEEPDIGGWVEIDVKELEDRIKASKSNLELSDLAYKLGDDIIVYPDGKIDEDVE